jgi:arylsulfatase A-like enzyme
MKRTLGLAILLSCVAAGASERPNVVMFAVDDMCDWIGPMGYKQAITPNMDRLAESGVTFMNGHTAGIFCAPSRAAVFSGRFASSTGCYESSIYFAAHPELRALQQVLQDGGYSTYGAGKLFHHPAGCIDMRGWDAFYAREKDQKKRGWPLDSWLLDDEGIIPQPFPNSVYNRTDRPTKARWFLEWGKVLNENEPRMADTMRTEWACDLLRRRHDKPFFVGVGLYAPHFPNYCPLKYFDLYDRDRLELPPYKGDDLDDLPAAVRKAKTARGRIHAHLEKIGAVKDAMHGYLACISYADAMLGRLLDALASGPNADNTIVVLWSDHGYHHGEKHDWGKHTLWERTSNVPYIWSGPGIACGKRAEASASLIDMFPTLVELCGVEDAQARDGVSLAPVLKDPARAKDRDVFLPGMRPAEYAVMNQNWRYIRYADGTEELYSVRQDPNEWDNLAGNPEFVDVKRRLAASAPRSFAPAVARGAFKMVIEGDDFHWEPARKKPPQVLPASVHGARMAARKNSDEATMSPVTIEGRPAWTSKVRVGKPTYFYFKLEDSAFRNGRTPAVQVRVTYLDRGSCGVTVQYDSSDKHANAEGRFKEATRFAAKQSGKWRTVVFNLDDAVFSGRANGGDLRLGFARPDAVPVVAEVVVKPLPRGAGKFR